MGSGSGFGERYEGRNNLRGARGARVARVARVARSAGCAELARAAKLRVEHLAPVDALLDLLVLLPHLALALCHDLVGLVAVADQRLVALAHPLPLLGQHPLLRLLLPTARPHARWRAHAPAARTPPEGLPQGWPGCRRACGAQHVVLPISIPRTRKGARRGSRGGVHLGHLFLTGFRFGWRFGFG
eukprot:4238188-Prymnesium_polylepis.2